MTAKYAKPKLTFWLRTLERPSNLENVRAALEAERARDEQFDGIKARPVPPVPDVEVRRASALLAAYGCAL